MVSGAINIIIIIIIIININKLKSEISFSNTYPDVQI